MTITLRSLTALAAPALLLAAPLAAQSVKPTTSAADFVVKAGASDKFEITSSKLLVDSKNPEVKSFAEQMITDHTQSTAMIQTAAKADKITVAPPMLTPMQTKKVSALRVAKGKVRDTLYLKQQKEAHQMALDLMQTYSTSGSSPNLKQAAGQIVPVVQGHKDMVDKMAM